MTWEEKGGKNYSSDGGHDYGNNSKDVQIWIQQMGEKNT